MRIHVHTDESKRLLEEVRSLGKLMRPKFEKISNQSQLHAKKTIKQKMISVDDAKITTQNPHKYYFKNQ